MYFVFVNNDNEAVRLFESVLHESDSKNILVTLPDGFELISYLQNVKRGESYPDLIVLTPEFLRISGMDLLELLKTDDLYRLIPVFMLLPESNEQVQEGCRRLGSEYMFVPDGKTGWASAVERMYAGCA